MGYKQRAAGRDSHNQRTSERLVSLDAFRGFIMIMLAAGGFGIAKFAKLDESAPVWQECDYAWWQWLAFHFDHPPWESIFGTITVSFWDLIQPSFMFMVGVAMPFSYVRREKDGHSGKGRFAHALYRAIVLTLLGVFLYSLRTDRTNWIFTNVLAQIGLGYFFVYLMLGRKFGTHIIVLAGILIGYFFFFYSNPPPKDFQYAEVNAKVQRPYFRDIEAPEIYEGSYAAWSKNANAAHHFDVWFLNSLRTLPAEDASPDTADNTESVTSKTVNGKAADVSQSDAATDDADSKLNSDEATEIAAAQPNFIRRWFFSNSKPYTFNGGGYTTLNFIPSIATMLLGLMCGQLLIGRRSKWANLGLLLIAGAVCMIDGLLMHKYMCPIVKRIWTPSWVLLSGGWVIWLLALFYFVFDCLPLKKLAFPLVVVGMNSLLMYMMGQLIRPWVTQQVVETHFAGVLESAFGANALADDMYGRLIYPTAVVAVFWLITFWLYCKKLFVRI